MVTAPATYLIAAYFISHISNAVFHHWKTLIQITVLRKLSFSSHKSEIRSMLKISSPKKNLYRSGFRYFFADKKYLYSYQYRITMQKYFCNCQVADFFHRKLFENASRNVSLSSHCRFLTNSLEMNEVMPMKWKDLKLHCKVWGQWNQLNHS